MSSMRPATYRQAPSSCRLRASFASSYVLPTTYTTTSYLQTSSLFTGGDVLTSSPIYRTTYRYRPRRFVERTTYLSPTRYTVEPTSYVVPSSYLLPTSYIVPDLLRDDLVHTAYLVFDRHRARHDLGDFGLLRVGRGGHGPAHRDSAVDVDPGLESGRICHHQRAGRRRGPSPSGGLRPRLKTALTPT